MAELREDGPLTLEGFEAWLRSQPPDAVVSGPSDINWGAHCPIGTYLNHAGHRVWVLYGYYSVEGEPYRLPGWGVEFVRLADRTKVRPITRRRALEILRSARRNDSSDATEGREA